jgi:hypothetical protein
MPKPATYTFTGLFLDCFCMFLTPFSISNFCGSWSINRPLVMELLVNFGEEAGCRFGILSLAKFSKLSKEPILLVHRSPGFLWHYCSMSKNKCECRWPISDVADVADVADVSHDHVPKNSQRRIHPCQNITSILDQR